MECGKPGDGTNTVPVPDGVDLVFGEKYIYSCLVGFELASPGVVTECTADGTFSLSDPPICTGKCHVG